MGAGHVKHSKAGVASDLAALKRDVSQMRSRTVRAHLVGPATGVAPACVQNARQTLESSGFREIRFLSAPPTDANRTRGR